MSTITTIQGTDVVKDSRAVINTNFSNLNTDKVETLSDLSLTKTASEYDDAVTNSSTDDERDAMSGGGDLGTPSATNKYATEDLFDTITSTPPQVVVFTADGTWTKDSGLKYVVVEVVGGGGGGDSAAASSNDFLIGDGGGGGAYSKKLILASALGATETVTVGAGGATGLDGEDTTFGSHLTGGKGLDNTIGGTATGGDINITGGFGGFGLSATQGNGPIGPAGRGGTSFYGGGASEAIEDDNGGNGVGYGSGGSGAFSNDSPVTGGVGADGITIVTEYY